jgi:ADP-ribose pyrophosphatase YjhB (NUDIX family)
MWRSLPGAGVLVVMDGRVLMVQHERSGHYRWELPSSLVDAGETFEQAAERETFEETGVAVAITALLCVAVMEVSSAEYRGVNLYYRAKAVSDVTPHPSAKKERISAAAYQDPAALQPSQIHPSNQLVQLRNGGIASQLLHHRVTMADMTNSGASPSLCLPVTRRGTERNHTAVPPGW